MFLTDQRTNILEDILIPGDRDTFLSGDVSFLLGVYVNNEDEIKDENDIDVLVNQPTKNGGRTDPVRRLFWVYKYVKKKKDMAAVREDARWDRLNGPDQENHLRKLLFEAYDGDIQKAAKAIQEIGNYYEKIGCMWDCRTILRRLTDWEEGRLGR